MKLAKRFMAAVLTALMALSLVGTALAAQEGELTGGSITINDAVPGQEYSAYQILYLESYSTDSNGVATGAYAYKANSAWADWLKTQTAYVAIDNQGYVTWVENADVKAFAALAQAYAATLTVADATDVAPAAAEGEIYSTVKFENLKLGYYLIDTTLGTLCSLNTTNPDVVMKEKNETTDVVKQVQEDSNESWGSSDDADINQVVNYKATVTVQAGAENYVLHDVMSEGLTYIGVTSVTIDGEAVDTANYTVTTDPTDGCTFEVAFKNEYISTLTKGTQIVVEYSARLNENAVVGLPGNPNKMKLQYGDAAAPTSTPYSETVTYTWDAKVVKFTTKDGQEVMLSGATFAFCTDAAGENPLKFHALGENKYRVCADAECGKDHVTEITTDATGTFLIEGLDSGTYYLVEIAAPAGYNKLAAAKLVTIVGAVEKSTTTGEDENAVTTTELTYSTLETKVENKAGAELPSTGGIGTTIFYIVGSVLVLGAIVLLVTKMRMGAKK